MLPQSLQNGQADAIIEKTSYAIWIIHGAKHTGKRREMILSYLFDWLSHHYVWTTLAILVIGGTVAVGVGIDRDH